jgi:hypothetical protein
VNREVQERENTRSTGSLFLAGTSQRLTITGNIKGEKETGSENGWPSFFYPESP